MLLGFRAKAIRKYRHAEKMTLQQSAGKYTFRLDASGGAQSVGYTQYNTGSMNPVSPPKPTHLGQTQRKALTW